MAVELTHLDESGRPRMVDVSEKPDTDRRAVAETTLRMRPETLEAILSGGGPKGAVLETAQVAGVMAAKRTWELIPMCHPIPITGVSLSFLPEPPDRLVIRADVRTTGKTGVEMEALAAVSVAALTVYDMVKAIDRGMEIGPTRLLQKSGGKSGDFRREDLEGAGADGARSPDRRLGG
ncbi:MAG: cyclic pyranopterin monophosphate synthase MoaC [Hydrogenibacillus schlegelii]|nr:cyclic pyranopterin monophosphate synthase MoaC [Hydrogenibacillus schlegelii]